jgi:class 3 adenylate cyclase
MADQTFLFSDLAGFTALTEAQGDERAADLVAEFCAAVRGRLAGHGAEEVKAIGDALLLRAERADDAVQLALEIVDGVGARHGFPSVRIGMHTGPAVGRAGDWFGATVNLASRVSDHARGGEVLVTRATHDAAAGAADVLEFRSRGAVRFKNVREPVELFAVARRGALPARRLVTDPVCRVTLDPGHAPASAVHHGREVHFCSQACADAYSLAPARYEGRRSRTADLRVSDNSRERAVSFLRRAYEQGVLPLEDFDERAAHAYAARTRAELSAVLRDLPSYRRWRLARRRRRTFLGFLLAPLCLARRVIRLVVPRGRARRRSR